MYVEGNYVYLGLATRQGVTLSDFAFPGGDASYIDSRVYQNMQNFENYRMSADALRYCQNVTVGNYQSATGKIFAASYVQLYSWCRAYSDQYDLWVDFQSYDGGYHYWTSDMSSTVMHVYYVHGCGGILVADSNGAQCYSRPFCKVQYKGFPQ